MHHVYCEDDQVVYMYTCERTNVNEMEHTDEELVIKQCQDQVLYSDDTSRHGP